VIIVNLSKEKNIIEPEEIIEQIVFQKVVEAEATERQHAIGDKKSKHKCWLLCCSFCVYGLLFLLAVSKANKRTIAENFNKR
jgi:hypothetical protein